MRHGSFWTKRDCLKFNFLLELDGIPSNREGAQLVGASEHLKAWPLSRPFFILGDFVRITIFRVNGDIKRRMKKRKKGASKGWPFKERNKPIDNSISSWEHACKKRVQLRSWAFVGSVTSRIIWRSKKMVKFLTCDRRVPFSISFSCWSCMQTMTVLVGYQKHPLHLQNVQVVSEKPHHNALLSWVASKNKSV